MGIARTGMAAIAMSVLLISCSPPTYDIIATMTNGVLVFNGRDSQGGTHYVEASTLSIMRGDTVIWGIAYDHTEACGFVPPGGHPFPLRYGAVPECWTQLQEPAALQTGVVYTVNGFAGSRQGGGDFRLSTGGVEFIDTMGNF